jgi:hypothetical protein
MGWAAYVLNIPHVSLRKTYNVKKLNQPIEFAMFMSLLLGFPVGYLLKPVPYHVALEIINKVDLLLADQVVQYVERIEQKIQKLSGDAENSIET